MKLRNKKTGEITTDFAYILLEATDYRTYNSISELCKDWEDYTTPEPLIKDEKILGGYAQDGFRKRITKIHCYLLSVRR